ncbi:MAG: hypothetical protein DRO12_05400 [Thermoprotei archaeon]|nr:MAG: hypothetical protein DRO12_05400 [Thermoprotei archaeon]
MGFSITLSETIMLIASVILASAISSYTMYMGNLVISDVSQSVNEMRRATYVKLKIAYATIDYDAGCFVIYVKNVGSLPISDYSSLDVYVGEYGKAQLYVYNEAGGPGCFNLTVLGDDGDGVWDPGETVRINAYASSIPTGAATFEVKLVPLRGIGDSHLFTNPPS